MIKIDKQVSITIDGEDVEILKAMCEMIIKYSSYKDFYFENAKQDCEIGKFVSLVLNDKSTKEAKRSRGWRINEEPLYKLPETMIWVFDCNQNRWKAEDKSSRGLI